MKKKTRRLIARHAAAGFLAAALVGGFWASRPQWSADMRLWKSFDPGSSPASAWRT